MKLKTEKLQVWGAVLAVVQLVACENSELEALQSGNEAARVMADSAVLDSAGVDSLGHSDSVAVPKPDTLRPDTIRPRPDTIRPRPDSTVHPPKPPKDSVRVDSATKR